MLGNCVQVARTAAVCGSRCGRAARTTGSRQWRAVAAGWEQHRSCQWCSRTAPLPRAYFGLNNAPQTENMTIRARGRKREGGERPGTCPADSPCVHRKRTFSAYRGSACIHTHRPAGNAGAGNGMCRANKRAQTRIYGAVSLGTCCCSQHPEERKREQEKAGTEATLHRRKENRFVMVVVVVFGFVCVF